MSPRFRARSPLVAGDVVGVCAPSGPVEPERLAAGVSTLERLGFRVRVPEGIDARTGFTAGDAVRRQTELSELLRADDVRAVICARGGGGAIELMPVLGEVLRTLPAPKPIVGYSDATFLHLLAARLGLVGLHGPMVARGLDGDFDEASFLHALTDQGQPYATGAGVLKALRGGSAEGILLGGCLSILASACGTPWALRPGEPTILLLEDVNEPPYRVHRMLWQLRLSGAFERVSGVVFGDMPGCGDPADGAWLNQAILSALAGLDLAIAIGLPVGHTKQAAVTLPLGVSASLICGGQNAHFEMLGTDLR